jgi:hypothetical protein
MKDQVVIAVKKRQQKWFVQMKDEGENAVKKFLR